MIYYLKKEYRAKTNMFIVVIQDEEFKDTGYILEIIYNRKTLVISDFNIFPLPVNFSSVDQLIRDYKYKQIEAYELLFNSFYKGLINAVCIKYKDKEKSKFFKKIVEKYKILDGGM